MNKLIILGGAIIIILIGLFIAADFDTNISNSDTLIDNSHVSETITPDFSVEVSSTHTPPHASCTTEDLTTPDCEITSTAPSVTDESINLETSSPEVPESDDVLPEIDWDHKKEECPEATLIWITLKSFGWTDAACAGVLGNIMRECGGNTLENIDHTRFNKSRTHFGLCQWSKKYYPEIQPSDDWVPSVVEQLEFLNMTINEYNGNHHVYGFTIDLMFTETDPRIVAKLFCEGYERPNETSDRRQKFALEAYEYFTGYAYVED